MLRHIRPALVMLMSLGAITGLVYPLLVLGLAQGIFPQQANGSLITKEGEVIGSALIGQSFTRADYFHGRPSAGGYDGRASGGSNLGPTSAVLKEEMSARAAKLRAENPNASLPLPVELISASASGLDPHISPEAALYQLPRVAKARGIAPKALENMVKSAVEPRLLGLLGEPVVNVLQLNLALDALQRAG